jgi:hypothetical protein
VGRADGCREGAGCPARCNRGADAGVARASSLPRWGRTAPALTRNEGYRVRAFQARRLCRTCGTSRFAGLLPRGGRDGPPQRVGGDAERIDRIACLRDALRRVCCWSCSTTRQSRSRRARHAWQPRAACGRNCEMPAPTSGLRWNGHVQRGWVGGDGGTVVRSAGCRATLADAQRRDYGVVRPGDSSNAPASEPAPLVARVVARWCGTY